MMMNARLLFPTSGGAKPGRLFAALAVGLLLPASTAPAATPGERGKPFLATFTPDEYDAQTQNWSVAQDQRGIVYAANLDGVLEYDGVRWRLIGTPGKISAWSLARGADGTLWVGASGDLGFLRPDSRGSGRFVSLLEHVPEGLRGFGAVRQIVPTPEGVFFLEARHLFRWRGGGEGDEPTAMKIWDLGKKDPSTFSHLSYVQDRLLVARQGVGLLELHGESFEPLAGSELFAEHSVEAVGSLEDGTLVVGTFTEGLFLYDGTSARRWETAAGAYARDKLTTGVTRLADGRFALTTYRGGVALFDRSGTVVRVVDKASGLPDNTVRGPAYEDAQGGLWLPLNHGLARVEVGSALEYYDDDLGLDGLILSVLRQRGTLYAGTTQGLFALEPAASGAGMAQFVRVAGIEGGCGDLLAFRDRLLAATSRGVFEVKTEP
ncbi:MAG: hypothetical protein GY856_18890, partial [bacterium]|nr:hypothetical protein [bacterium]